MFKAVALAMLAGVISSSPAFAQKFPERTVQFVVPYSAGGGMDASARLMTQKLAEKWGVSVIVENKPGGGGNIGSQFVSRAKPDGYTLLLGDGTITSVNPLLYKEMGFDPHKDLVPITLLSTNPYVLVVNPDKSQFKTLRELLDDAKANPGRPVNWGGSPLGTIDHLSHALLNKLAGAQVAYIPYKGAGDALIDLLGGRIQIATGSYKSVEAFLSSNKVRPIAVTSAERLAALPDVPTVAQSGVPEFGEMVASIVIWAPRGTPKPIIQKIYEDLKEIMERDEVKRYYATSGYTAYTLSPEQTEAWMAKEVTRNPGIVDLAGLKKN